MIVVTTPYLPGNRIDPTSSRTMRVWVDPGSGERRYVAED